MNKTLQILKANGLSRTEIRIQILDLFLKSETALSLPAIKAAFKKERGGTEELDRITLYRTLKAFEEKGIIHEAVDGTNHPKYALCEDHCTEHNHEDNHAHFHCTTCEKTTCLEHVPTPNIPNVPQGYNISETNLILSGTCADCLVHEKV